MPVSKWDYIFGNATRTVLGVSTLESTYRRVQSEETPTWQPFFGYMNHVVAVDGQHCPRTYELSAFKACCLHAAVDGKFVTSLEVIVRS